MIGARRVAAVAALVGLTVAGCSATTPKASPGNAVSHAITPGVARPSAARSSGAPSPVVPLDLVHAAWTHAIREAAGDRNVSVAVGIGDRIVFSLAGATRRLPASNEKLLTSMAALSVFGPGHRFPTRATATNAPRDGVLSGDLWLVGSGDPELSDAGLATLASRLVGGGLREVRGSVMGDTSAFDRGWWAPGWLPGISREFVTRPTALALDGNVVADPEPAAAASLTRALQGDDVRVAGRPVPARRRRARGPSPPSTPRRFATSWNGRTTAPSTSTPR
jgi:D-alanyl-D-alanine carboxypeptidase